jgi:hypothetical protein
MISTISPVFCGTTAPTAPAAAPKQAEQPKCPDSLDFAKIDSPLEAALLPATEPALQVSLAAGVMFAVMAGAFGGAIPLVSIDFASKSADKLMNVRYDLDLKNESNPLTVSGDVDGQALTETFTLNEQTESAAFNGSIGNNPTSLTLALDQASEALRVSGKLGDIDADLKYTAIKGPNGDDDIQGLHTEGTLGGLAYSADTLFEGGAQALANGAEQGKMTVRGTLGQDAISKDYTVTAQQLPSGAEITFTGTGTTAGVQQEVSATLTIVG